MTRKDAAVTAAGLRDILGRDHRRLEKLFDYLLEEFEAGDRAGTQKMWTRFEGGLTAHLNAEEKYLLPIFGKAYPAEAAALLHEHQLIRARVEELGVGVELHLVNLAIARELVETLRAHARREDEMMYGWAEREAGLAELEALASEVGH
jgi:hemerythrin